MVPHNAEMAAVYEQIADLLEIQGANPFRVRAYRNGARSVGEFGKSVPAMIEQNEDVKRIAGIGDDLAAAFHEAAEHGLIRTVPVGGEKKRAPMNTRGLNALRPLLRASASRLERTS